MFISFQELKHHLKVRGLERGAIIWQICDVTVAESAQQILTGVPRATY